VGVEYITGVVKVEGKLVILLDLQRVLSVQDFQTLDEGAEAFAEAEAA
jgi:chemotaxis signal transduction protein